MMSLSLTQLKLDAEEIKQGAPIRNFYIKCGEVTRTFLERTVFCHISYLEDEQDIIPIIELALEKGENINYQDIGCNTPLMNSMQSGSKNVFEMLIKHGASRRFINNDGNSCLHLCLMYGNSEMLQMLLTPRSDLFLKNNKGENVLSLLKKQVDKIIKCNKSAIEYKDSSFEYWDAEDIIKMVSIILQHLNEYKK